MKNAIRRASPAALPLAVAILLGSVSLPSAASAQTAEERLTALEKALAEKKGEIAKLDGQVQALRRDMGLSQPAAPPSTPLASSNIASEAPAAEEHECSLESANGRAREFSRDDLNYCPRLALTADEGGQFRAGRVADRRGFRGRINATGDSTEATLEFTTTTSSRFLRSTADDPAAGQRIVSKDYTFGIRGPVEDGKKSARLGNLDEIQGGVNGYLRFSRNTFLAEDKADVLTRGDEKLSPLQDTCKKDDDWTKSNLANADRCSGLLLYRWIFEKDPKKGGFLHPEAVEAYNAVYWSAPKDSHPVRGLGFEVGAGRPKFEYYPFATKEVEDPFQPGKMKTVIDPDAFPADFYAKRTKNDSRYNFSLRGFGYVHGNRSHNPFDGLPNLFAWSAGTTLIASVTYKRDWNIRKEFKDLEICPIPKPGVSFTDGLLCRKINAAAPEIEKGFVIGGQIRQQIEPGWRFLPPIGIDAKLTHQTWNGRYGLEVPIYFASDKDGALNGGLRLGGEWGGTNDDGTPFESDWSIGIFFGTTFDLHGGK
ncbi:MAG TPA: hypothetical protein VF605_04595 [Allosphingosinicella sp.]|jgi:hypothetical protein